MTKIYSATSDVARSIILSKGKEREEWRAAGFVATEADMDLAQKALEWARSFYGSIPVESRSDFEHNMYVATKGDAVTRKTAGFAAYAVQAYLKEMALVEERKRAASTSKHVGVVGEKISLASVLVNKVIVIDSMYGTSYLYILVDEAGNQLKWKASSQLWITPPETEAVVHRPAAIGDVLKNFTGKVKEHGEFNGVPQTTLTHCKVLTDEEVAAAEAKAAKKGKKKVA